VDPRVEKIAKGALLRLSTETTPSAPAGPSARDRIHLDRMTIEELRNLAGLHLEDPSVKRVVEALRAGIPVTLDREALEKFLGLQSYPPRLREQFARWFSRIAGYGVALVGEGSLEPAPAAPPPAPVSTPPAPKPEASSAALTPDRLILAAILEDEICGEKPCVLEPGKICDGSGRCRTLGF